MGEIQRFCPDLIRRCFKDMISVWSSVRQDIGSGGLSNLAQSSKYLKCTSCDNSLGNKKNSTDDIFRALISLEVLHILHAEKINVYFNRMASTV